jgi:hypothetical protein
VTKVKFIYIPTKGHLPPCYSSHQPYIGTNPHSTLLPSSRNADLLERDIYFAALLLSLFFPPLPTKWGGGGGAEAMSGFQKKKEKERERESPRERKRN